MITVRVMSINDALNGQAEEIARAVATALRRRGYRFKRKRMPNRGQGVRVYFYVVGRA